MKNKGMSERARRPSRGTPGTAASLAAVLVRPALFRRGMRCISVIARKFFLFQYRAVLFPRLPVSSVDHPLDAAVPFNPGFIRVYLDFTGFWIRIAGFLCRYGKAGRAMAGEFIGSITDLYLFALEVYSKNLSTTARPRYRGSLLFRIVHALDPHLMCVPSLHVMLMIHSYTAFRRCLSRLGEEEAQRPLDDAIFRGAVVITEAILYVKQHSVNCVAATLYAMSRFDPSLFGDAEAETFVNSLFAAGGAEDVPAEYAPYYKGPLIQPPEIPALREYILTLYRTFAGQRDPRWAEPLLEFLKAQPAAGGTRGRDTRNKN